MRTTIALAAALATLAACSSATETPGSSSNGDGSSNGTSSSPTEGTGGQANTASATCGKAGRTGITECKRKATTCNAGTYCNTDFGKDCIPGCTSDAECGENDHCVKCSDEFGPMDVGTCQSCSVTKEEACKGSSRNTESLCRRDTTRDGQCKAFGGGKGYSCPPDEEPNKDGCEQLPGSGLDWCCEN